MTTLQESQVYDLLLDVVRGRLTYSEAVELFKAVAGGHPRRAGVVAAARYLARWRKTS